MASSNMRKLVIGCGAAVIAVAVVFWALSLLAAGAWHRELAPESRGASTTFECEDTQLIAQVVDALRSIELGDTTTLAASDAGERLDFLLADGTRRSFYFEAGAYTDGDASRVMTKGGDALSRALRTVRESGAVAETAARDGR